MEHDQSIRFEKPRISHEKALLDTALMAFYMDKNWKGIKSFGYSKEEIKRLKKRRRRKIREEDITPSPEADISAVYKPQSGER